MFYDFFMNIYENDDKWEGWGLYVTFLKGDQWKINKKSILDGYQVCNWEVLNEIFLLCDNIGIFGRTT